MRFDRVETYLTVGKIEYDHAVRPAEVGRPRLRVTIEMLPNEAEQGGD